MANLDQYGQPLRDPASAILQRKYALAQALQRQGMDTSPVVGTGNNSMQAIARVLQAGLGGYLGSRAEAEAQTMSAAQKDERDRTAAMVQQLTMGAAPVAAPSAAPAPSPEAPPMTERLGGAPPVEPPAPVPQVQQQPLPGPTGPSGPPSMYGRNAGAAAQRDAMLDAPPQVLADASSARAAASGLPTNVAYRGATPASEGGDWDRGVPAPTGAVPAFGAGAPRAALAAALAPPAAAASPGPDLDSIRQRAGALRALAARGAPGAAEGAAALEAQANRLEARQYRVEDTAESRRLAASAADERRREREVDNRRQDEALGLQRDAARRQEEAARNSRLPTGYAYGSDGQPRRLLPENPDGKPYSGTALEAQNRNILATADPGSQQYAAAYADLASQRVNADGSTVTPNMSAYRSPTFRPDGATETPNYARATTTPATQMNGEQGKAATFADRIAEALPVIERTADASMSRTQQGLSRVPLVGNSLVSSGFQEASQSERNFVNAVLRRESGAVISPEEFANARKQYIPQPGDDEATLKLKRENRETVLNGMRRDAGPAYRPAEPAAAPAQGGGWSIRPVQ